MAHEISRRVFLVLANGAFITAADAFAQQNAEVPPLVDEVPLLLDHILLGCGDLQRGIEFVERHTGVRAAFGGIHPGRATQNALLSLGELHYLEIIAPDPQQSLAPDRYGLRKLVEPKLIGWAVHPDNLQTLADRLTHAGIAFEGPTPGTRNRPDGRTLEWKTLHLNDDAGGLLPFFIEWSPASTHPSADAPKGCRLLRLEAATPDPVKLGRLAARLGLKLPMAKSTTPQLRAAIAGPKGELAVTS